MKKMLLLAILVIAFIYAAYAKTYTVTTSKGKITTRGKKVVKVCDKITESTYVDIGPHSTLIFIDENGNEYRLSGMKKGTIYDLLFKKNNAPLGTVKGDTESKSPIQTASSRASDAKEDLDWDDE